MGKNNRLRRQRKATARRGGAPDPRARAAAAGVASPGASSERVEHHELHRRVALLISEGVSSLAYGGPAAAAALADRLSALCETPATRSMVVTQVTALLTSAVTSAWSGGWQPVDVHRYAGRQLTPGDRLLLTDAIAHEMATYASGSVDPRWVAQIRELDVVAWWPRESTYLDARRLMYGEGWATLLTRAFAVLGFLGWLPRLERLMPVPGSVIAPPAPRGSGGSRTVDERMLSRVRALLAKAESTTFEAEAEAFTAAAQALMARHNIDAAVLAAEHATDDTPEARRIGVDNPYESAKMSLLDAVATANRCRAVWSRELGFATTFGFAGDLDAVEMLFTSLLVQATTAMTSAGSRTDWHGRSRTRSFRQAFLVAYAGRIGERLQEVTRGEVAEAQASDRARGRELAPLLAARSEQVDSAVEAMFPVLTYRKSSSRLDAEGWYAGRAAADLASLGPRAAVERTPGSTARAG